MMVLCSTSTLKKGGFWGTPGDSLGCGDLCESFCSCRGTGQLSLHRKTCISLQGMWSSATSPTVCETSNSTLKQLQPSVTAHTLTAHPPVPPSGCPAEAGPPQLCSPFLLSGQGQQSPSMQRWFLACWAQCSSGRCCSSSHSPALLSSPG